MCCSLCGFLFGKQAMQSVTFLRQGMELFLIAADAAAADGGQSSHGE
jgi:hypothetical protein